MTAAVSALPRYGLTFHWMRGRRFDLVFIFGFTLVALSVAALLTHHPELALLVLMTDGWLLGAHHVVSTYTRIGFGWKNARENFFLLGPLPFIVFGIVLLLSVPKGEWLIPTIYLYWGWFHNMRQSYGITRYYLAKSDQRALADHWSNTAAIYLVPITGILYRSWQAPDMMLGMKILTVPVPLEVVVIVGAAAAFCMAAQFSHWIKLYRQNALPAAYVSFTLVHYIMFITAYMLVSQINFGWQTMSIWHNLQYIAFVWMMNAQRYHGKGGSDQPLIARISQENRAVVYFALCVFLGTVLATVMNTLATVSEHYSLFSTTIIFMMTLNFHYYIVDAIIWRRKRNAAAVPAMAHTPA